MVLLLTGVLGDIKMDMYYSASMNGFYDGDLKDRYIAGTGWPNDCAEISDDIYYKYIDTPPKGKIRVSGVDGSPMWGDAPEPTHDEQVAASETEKQSRISQANDFMNSRQWPGKAAVGRLKGDDLAQYNLWLDYLDALEAVDTSTAPDINWPIPLG